MDELFNIKNLPPHMQSYFTFDEDWLHIIKQLKDRIIPDHYPETYLAPQDPFSIPPAQPAAFLVRDEVSKLSSHALIANCWIRPLASWIGQRKCLEIMCGSGCLAKALQDNGVHIIATDDHSFDETIPYWFTSPWTTVEKIDCVDAIEKYGPDVDIVICSWPYMDNCAYQSLLKMRKVNPNALMIYIGENGGANADSDFFSAIEYVDDSAFEEAVSSFRQFRGMHDWPNLIK